MITKTNKRLLTAALLLLPSLCATAADDYSIGNVTFADNEGTFNNIQLKYRKAIIGAADEEKPALVIYMHGGSSKGNDNITQMGEKGIDSIANYLSANNMASVFIVPQCPANKSWGGQMNDVIKQLIDTNVKQSGIDTERIYIFGGSMGGTATWGLVSAYPSLFTAAMPVAGNPSKAVASNVAKTPIYAVMGTADAIMKVELVSDFIAELNQLGDNTALDVEEGWTHEMTCIQSYTSERLKWVFANKKGNDTAVASISNEQAAPTAFFTLDGRRIDKPTKPGLYIARSNGNNDGRAQCCKIIVK